MHAADLIDVAHRDGDVRRRLVARDRLPSLPYVGKQAEPGRLDVLVGDAEARNVSTRACDFVPIVSIASAAVSASACTPVETSAMSGDDLHGAVTADR